MIQQTLMRNLVFSMLLIFWTSHGVAQQVTDENFNYAISVPMYQSGSGSVLLFDEAHNNASTLKGSYAAFGNLLASDGYNVISTKEKVTSELLKTAKIYVTVNAMYDMQNWNLPARSAFSRSEINVLSHWVSEGGSLFIVTDHMPCGASVNDLAGEFGINVINGFALRKDGFPEVFSRGRNTLISNDITNHAGEKIDSIMCWGGTGFVIPTNAHIISLLGEDYNVYLPYDVSQIKRPLADTIPYISGRGIVNGAYLKFGEGRIVVFGDGATFSAQLHGIKSEKRGMNHPWATQNAQFLLNIIHWLEGV